MYTCCTDIRDWDQSKIKQSSCKIGNDQAIKMSVYAAQSRSTCLLTSIHTPAHLRLAIKDQASLSSGSSNQGTKMNPIKF